LSICLLIQLDTLLLGPSLHCDTFRVFIMRLLGPCACLRTRTAALHISNTYSVFRIVLCHKSSGLRDIRAFWIVVLTTSAWCFSNREFPRLKSKFMCYLCCVMWSGTVLASFFSHTKCNNVLNVFCNFFCHNATLFMLTYARMCTSFSYIFRQLLPSSPEGGSNYSASVIKCNVT
jgi:hypothetical protein